MKKYLLILSVLFISFNPAKSNPIDRIGVSGPLMFNQVSYSLAWSDKPRDTYYIQEYLPEGENVNSFSRMLTIHLFDVDITVEDAVHKKVNELENRIKTDPTCNYEVNRSPDGKEIIIDFILGENNNNENAIAEFNIYRYRNIDLGNNINGLLVYAYSERSYGEKITDYYKSLKANRPELISKMSLTELPVISLSKE